MIANLSGQKFHCKAFNLAGKVTGDAANITCTLAKDDGSRVALTDANPVEIGTTAEYVFDVTLAETIGYKLSFVPVSGTAGVQVVGNPSGVIYTRRKNPNPKRRG